MNLKRGDLVKFIPGIANDDQAAYIIIKITDTGAVCLMKPNGRYLWTIRNHLMRYDDDTKEITRDELLKYLKLE